MHAQRDIGPRDADSKTAVNACASMAVVRCGWLPRSGINTSAAPNALPGRIPKSRRFHILKFRSHLPVAYGGRIR
jgi:hypothetical protein